MARLVPITRAQFQDKGWLRPTNFTFAAAQAAVPLTAAEFARAALALPIAFTQDGDRYVPAALLSPLPGRNLFVGPDGRWLGAYLPAFMRAYPFVLARAEGAEEYTLCIDEESGLVVPADQPGAAPFFEGEAPAATIQALVRFLREVEQSRALTDHAVASLAEAGLIQPWPMHVALEGEPKPVSGLFRIDEAGLANVSDEVFLQLRRTGALPLAYLQMLSSAQVGLFERLAQLHVQQPAKPPVQEPVANSAAAMEELFQLIDPKGELFG